MKKSEIVIIIVAVVAFIGIILLLRLINVDDKYNWAESYRSDSDQPYGTLVLTKLLEDYFPNDKLTFVTEDINKPLTEITGEHRTYMFIGSYPYYTDSTLDNLKQFVQRGNDVFIATNAIPENFSSDVLLGNISGSYSYDTVYYLDSFGDSTFSLQENYEEDPNTYSNFETSKIGMNFHFNELRKKEGYQFGVMYKDEVIDYTWNYFFPDYEQKMIPHKNIGTIYSKNFTNFIQVPYGSGNFYIHTNPIVFTNFFQIQEDKITYTSKLLSYLKPGEIIWDNFSRSLAPPDPNNDQQEEGPLKFILGEKTLRWAWYSILAGLGLFLIFRSKRLQQPIPVLEPNENKSLEFIQTIGRMYYLKKNHKQLAQQKLKLFLHFINERYRIPGQEIDEIYIEKVRLKSEISENHLKQIFKHIKYINNTNDVTDQDIVQLHELLDYFYKNCK